MSARRTLKVTGHSKGTWALGQSRHLGLGHSGFWALDGHLCTQALRHSRDFIWQTLSNR